LCCSGGSQFKKRSRIARQGDAASRGLLALLLALLARGDIHRDFKAETHIGEAGGRPLHARISMSLTDVA
jgi:hypothetical protein